MNPDLSKLPLCDQEWDAMEPLGDGRRLCARCRHPVTDFRGMTKHEITLLHVMSGERVCGVYSPEQLAPVTAAEPRRFRSGLVTLTLGASLLAARAQAQATAPAPHEQAQLPPGAQAPLQAPEHTAEQRRDGNDAQDVLVIRGTVRDDRTGLPLPHAMVRIAGRDLGTVTDSGGGYTLRVPNAGRGELHVFIGRIGYETFTTPVRANRTLAVADVRLRSAAVGVMGFAVVAEPGGERARELRKVGYSVTRIIGSP